MISAELQKTIEYVKESRKAIIYKGGSIADDAGLKDFPQAIFNLPVGDSSIVEVVDDSTAYEKIILAGAKPKARINSVGGATIRHLYNLIDPTVIYNMDVPHTVNDDGSISFVMPASANGYVRFFAPLPTEAGVYKYSIGLSHQEPADFACVPSAIMQIEEGAEVGDIEIIFELTTSAAEFQDVNITAWITLTKDESKTSETVELVEDTSTPFKRYGYEFKHAKTERIESIGANLIPFPYSIDGVVKDVGYTETINGITWTVLEGGRVMGNGTASKRAIFNFAKGVQLPPDIYCLSGGFNGNNFVCVSAYKGGYEVNPGYSTVPRIDFTSTEYDEIRGRITIEAGQTANNLIFEPMFSKYQTTKPPFAPYKAEPIETINIPTTVQALDGFGEGVNSEYCNKIIFENGKVLYYKNCKTLVFNGTEDIYAGGNSGGTTAFYEYSFLPRLSLSNSNAISNANAINLISTHFTPATRNEVYARNTANLICADYEYVRMSSAFETAAELKAYLAELNAKGTPLTIIYALAEPIVTDITEYFSRDNLIEVEGGGVLRFVNEEKKAVPSKITYIRSIE